jgi:hypothetical protein
MWDLDTINYRNQALASKLTATEINFLNENKIYPVVGYTLEKKSIERIKVFKEEQARIKKNGKSKK